MFQDNTGTLPMLMSAVKNSGHVNLQEKMKVLRNTFLTHREMGECEA